MKNNNKKIAILVATIALFAFLMGVGASFLASNYIIDNRLKKLSQTGTGLNTSNLDVDKVMVKDKGLATAIERVYNAVVMIESNANGTFAGSGSGFVYKVDDKYGYIMTNHHVIEDATGLNIRFANDKEAAAKLLGSDEYLDIAVLQVDKKDIIQQAPIGKSSDSKLGDTIFAIGSPVGGEYYNTVTSGIISGMNRKLTVSVNSREDWIMEAIQVDAAINPGNSGGPLLNASGEVIGVNSLKLVDNTIEGMGFAIKIEDALAHATELEKGKAIDRPLLGINLTSVSNKVELARSGISLDPSIESGVVVISVIDGSGASKSELRKGDVITMIDDQVVESPAYLKYILYKYRPGDKIKVTYMRDKSLKTTTVSLTKAN